MASSVPRCLRASRLVVHPSFFRPTADSAAPLTSFLTSPNLTSFLTSPHVTSFPIAVSLHRAPPPLTTAASHRLSRHFGLFSQAEKKETSENPENPESPSPATEGEALELLQKSQDLVIKLETENKKLIEEKEEVKDKYKRSIAETENVRNRMQKQISDAKIFAIQGFCKDLLEVADILEKAVELTPKDKFQENPDLRDLYDGLSMTETQLHKVFSRNGLLRLKPEPSDKFDPNLHEALFQMPQPDQDDNTVACVTQVGYVLNSRTLRAAKVGVVKNS